MKQRFLFIDQLRAFAIFLIIFEHNDHSSIFSEFSTSFSIPIFFILSAFVSKDIENVKFSSFLAKKIKRLLVPYFTLSFLLYLFWYFLGRHYGESVEYVYSTIKNLIGIFYAQGGPEFMNWGIPMWFLPALFITSFVDYFVSRVSFKLQIILALILSLSGFFLFKLLGFHLPWSIEIAFALYGFYFLGKILRKVDFIKFLSVKKFSIPTVLIFGAIHLLSFHYNGRILYYYGDYGNFLLMYLNGIVGFIWVFTLFSIVPTSKIVVWVGQNTLPILAFHLLAMTFIKGIFYFGFNIEIEFNVLLAILYAMLQIVILTPLILLLNRHFPFLVGIQKKTNSDANPSKD
jgi:fucose 4-O-acetylase-like acetyltransferase